jgi:hypothetical protein
MSHKMTCKYRFKIHISALKILAVAMAMPAFFALNYKFSIWNLFPSFYGSNYIKKYFEKNRIVRL